MTRVGKTTVSDVMTDFAAALTNADVDFLCPDAAEPCTLTAELELYGERFGGSRELCTWTNDVVPGGLPVVESVNPQRIVAP